MDMFGISNVVDCEPIFGSDGIADGFVVTYTKTRKIKTGRKSLSKMIHCKKTVYVREFDSNSVKNDSTIHGFGSPTVYTKKVKRPKTKKVVKVSKNTFNRIMSK